MIKAFLIKVIDYFRFHRCYSLDGEDMIVRSFYDGQKRYKGYYVDVGAHHPVRFSNTYHFYLKGWRGINIDPMPGSMRGFNWLRRHDVNLEVGIGKEKSSLNFYCFNEPALNTFSEEVAEDRLKNPRYKVVKQVNVPVLPLSEVLEQHLPTGQRIDFLSVDVEGLDEVVLRSNNWQKYRPTYVLAEDWHGYRGDGNTESSAVYHYLYNLGYRMVARTQRTLIFLVVQASE